MSHSSSNPTHTGGSFPAHELARAGSFDTLRLLFVFAVLYTHSVRFLAAQGHVEFMDWAFGQKSTWEYGTGDLAVDGFFALSGFLIAMSRDRCDGTFSYLRNRILRIYPGFIVASLVCLLLVAPVAAPSMHSWWTEFSPLRALVNLVRLKPPEATVFVGTIHPELDTSMWSISHEFRCYVIVAAIALVAPRRWRPWAWGSLLALCVAILGSGWHAPVFPFRDMVFGGGESEARLVGSFAMGALYFHLMPWHDKFRRFFPVVAAALLWSLFHEAALRVAIPTVLALSYIQVGLSRRVAKWIPKPSKDISYGIYLYAWPIQKLLIMGFPGIDLWTHVLASSVLASACGWLSWTCVESRFMKLKARRTSPQAA